MEWPSVAGFALRNLPGIGPAVGEAVNDETSAWMRTAALGVILTCVRFCTKVFHPPLGFNI